MSERHPIIAITGSSGAGTSSVTRTFENIFRRENVKAAVIEGDSFHRYDRLEMRKRQAEAEQSGDKHFSHFGPENNLFPELEQLFASYAESGSGRRRKYLHDPVEAAPYKQDPGTFTPWETLANDTDLLFYEGLHGAVVTPEVNIARHPDHEFTAIAMQVFDQNHDGQLTVDEVLATPLTRGLFRPDTDTDGDGAADAMSFGVGFDCVPATFTPPAS